MLKKTSILQHKFQMQFYIITARISIQFWGPPSDPPPKNCGIDRESVNYGELTPRGEHGAAEDVRRPENRKRQVTEA